MTSKTKSPMEGEPCANCGHLYGKHNQDDLSCPGGFDNHGWSHDWMEITFKSKCCGGTDYHEWGCLGYERMKALGEKLGVNNPKLEQTLNDRKRAVLKTLTSKPKKELVAMLVHSTSLKQLEEMLLKGVLC